MAAPTCQARRAAAELRDLGPAHNAPFAMPGARENSAFTPIPGVDLDGILCVEEDGRSATTPPTDEQKQKRRHRRRAARLVETTKREYVSSLRPFFGPSGALDGREEL